MRRSYFILLLVVLVMPSCTTTHLFMDRDGKPDTSASALDPVFHPNSRYEYQVRVNDKISVSVWLQDELSVGSVYGIYNSNEVYGKWLLVDADGNIELPRIGTMSVERMRVTTLKDTLVAIYSEWLVNPVVDVKVLNKEITVLGEVRNPQVLTIDTEQVRLLDAIGRTNGFDVYANLKHIKVLRQVGDDVHVANIDLSLSDAYFSRNIALYPGDVVIVPAQNAKRFNRELSNIIPFTSVATAVAILLNTF